MNGWLLGLHLTAAVIWVGGMFFAYVCLRPEAAVLLPPPQRLPLWQGVLRRFFVWVWVSLSLLLLSGLATLFQTGLAQSPPHWHGMTFLGVLMGLVFVELYIRPWASFRSAVSVEDWPGAGAALNAIRQRVAFNLGVGFLNLWVIALVRI